MLCYPWFQIKLIRTNWSTPIILVLIGISQSDLCKHEPIRLTGWDEIGPQKYLSYCPLKRIVTSRPRSDIVGGVFKEYWQA